MVEMMIHPAADQTLDRLLRERSWREIRAEQARYDVR